MGTVNDIRGSSDSNVYIAGNGGVLLQGAVAINNADGDLVADEVDNCPVTYNSAQEDPDSDGTGDICEPVLVDLSTLNADARSGSVVLHRETSAEIDNAGFHVYRAADENGTTLQITRSITAGHEICRYSLSIIPVFFRITTMRAAMISDRGIL